MSNIPKRRPYATSAVHDGVSVITIHNPPVNALSSDVPDAITAELEIAWADPGVHAIVLTGSGRNFVAGVDIREFGEMSSGRRPLLDYYAFLLSIEDSPKPVIAAIRGTALGGGLELAMAAHYRLVTADAQLGQPEVKLGLIPGMAGTQRLPRLVGMVKAAEMCVWGEPISAWQAVENGLADRLIDGDLLEQSLAFARDISGSSRGLSPSKCRNLKVLWADLSVTRQRLSGFRRFGGAPSAALEAIEASILPFEEGCRVERQLFEQRVASTESKALVYAFFGERSAGRTKIDPKPVAQVGVVGAGTMGTGIALAFADAGFPVRLKDSNETALSRGLSLLQANYERSLAKGRIAPDDLRQRFDRIHTQLDYSGFEHADIVVEAVFEKLKSKQQIFRELSTIVRPDCLLATNTSSLDIDAIASFAVNPQRVLGMHFFSPANVMRLLEIVRAHSTANESIATALALGKQLGKIAVVSANSPGFIGNRIFAPYFREARQLVEAGASVEQVNNALTDWGMAMGPLAVDDLTGLDIISDIEGLAGRQSPLLRALIETGRLGQKNSRGWSVYGANRKPQADPEVEALARNFGKSTVTDPQIVSRCIHALIEESRKVLDEGIAATYVDIDMVAIHGFGFPAWRGGPMFYAESTHPL